LAALTRRAFSPSAATAFFLLLIGSSAQATWYDSSTGQPIHVTPRGHGNIPDDNHATIHDIDGKHIRDLYWDVKCSTWRDSRTGEEVRVTPRGSGNIPDDNHATIHDIDGKHVRDLYWKPCPQPDNANQLPGGSTGGMKSHSHVHHAKPRSEDDPLYMEDYQPPRHSTTGPENHPPHPVYRPHDDDGNGAPDDPYHGTPDIPVPRDYPGGNRGGY
jgi:hypothetical protein